MPKKKQPKNSFYFFMLELQEQYERRGEHYNMRQMADVAAPKWKLLTAEDRKEYEEMAKEDKHRKRNNDGILDSYGNSVAEILRQEKELESEEKRMEVNIDDFIKYRLGGVAEVAVQPFFFISTKIFCCTDEGEYLPAEVGLVEYALADGIVREYHKFIDPGPLPLGYSFACKETSDRTHKIPFQNFELADDDYRLISSTIQDILSRGFEHATFPPIYCSKEEMEQTKYILNWLQVKGNMRNPVEYIIYDASFLMFKLHQFSSHQMCSVALVRDYLSTSHFTYSANACCEWHWNEDSPEHCALGTVKRMCFIFSDHLCENFNITPLPSKHLPEKEPDEPPEAPPFLPKPSGRPRSNASYASKPPIDREIDHIVTNIKSRFNLEEDKYYVPSASVSSASASRNSATAASLLASKKSAPKVLEPLREPKSQHMSFSEVAYPAQPKQQFTLEECDFPGLDDTKSVSSRSESSMSLASFGPQSTISRTSTMTSSAFSIPNNPWVRQPLFMPTRRPGDTPTFNHQQAPIVMQTPDALIAAKNSSLATSSRPSPIPIGRGIGRGRPVEK